MNPLDEQFDAHLKNKLQCLEPVPARDARFAARGRANFLTVAESYRPAVSPRAPLRHNSWLNFLTRKERWSMGTITMLVLAVTLLLGGSGVAVYAAQDAMPNHPLYAIKLATEDARMSAETNTQARAELALDFANRRMNEIATMAMLGDESLDVVMMRQQTQIETAWRAATSLDDAAMIQELLRVRETLERQLQTMQTVGMASGESATPILERMQTMLRTQIALTDLGLQDPQRFRAVLQTMTQEQSQQNRPATLPTPGSPQPTDAPPPTPVRQMTAQPHATVIAPLTAVRQMTAQPNATGVVPPTAVRQMTAQPQGTPRAQPTGAQPPTKASPQPQSGQPSVEPAGQPKESPQKESPGQSKEQTPKEGPAQPKPNDQAPDSNPKQGNKP